MARCHAEYGVIGAVGCWSVNLALSRPGAAASLMMRCRYQRRAGHRRYLILEHSWTLDDQPTTVLAEWTLQGHVNYGPGPEAFLGSLAQLIL